MLKTVFKIIFAIILLFIICLVYFVLYAQLVDRQKIKSGYYLGEGVFFAEDIGKLALETNDPAKCGKIRTHVMAAMGPHEIELQQTCYYYFSKNNTDESLCKFIPPDQGPGGNTRTTPELCKNQAIINSKSK